MLFANIVLYYFHSARRVFPTVGDARRRQFLEGESLPETVMAYGDQLHERIQKLRAMMRVDSDAAVIDCALTAIERALRERQEHRLHLDDVEITIDAGGRVLKGVPVLVYLPL